MGELTIVMACREWSRLPSALLVEAIAGSTTWSEVDLRLEHHLIVDRWWAGIPYPGPLKMSRLVKATHEEKCRLFDKHGPGGRFEWPEEWNRGAW